MHECEDDAGCLLSWAFRDAAIKETSSPDESVDILTGLIQFLLRLCGFILLHPTSVSYCKCNVHHKEQDKPTETMDRANIPHEKLQQLITFGFCKCGFV